MENYGTIEKNHTRSQGGGGFEGFKRTPPPPEN